MNMIIRLRRMERKDISKVTDILADGEICLLYDKEDDKYVNGSIVLGNGKDRVSDLPEFIISGNPEFIISGDSVINYITEYNTNNYISRVKREFSAELDKNNPIFENGEAVYDITNQRLYIGNGSEQYKQLPYIIFNNEYESNNKKINFRMKLISIILGLTNIAALVLGIIF